MESLISSLFNIDAYFSVWYTFNLKFGGKEGFLFA